MDTRPPPYQRESGWRCWCHRVRRFALFILLLVALGVVLAHHALEQVDEHIRCHIQSKLAADYPHLRIHVARARRVKGRGIEIRGLAFNDPLDPEGPLLYVDEIRLSGAVELEHLLNGQPPPIEGVFVRGVRLRARVFADGRVDLASLFPAQATNNKPLPSIAVREGQIDILMETPEGWRRWQLRDVQTNIDLIASGSEEHPKGVWRLRGWSMGDHFRRAGFDVLCDVATKAWSARGDIGDLQLSSELVSSLPTPIADRIAPIADLRGQTSFDYVLHDAKEGGGLQFEVQGSFRDGRLSDPQLAYAINRLSADYYCDNRQLRIENAEARTGQAVVKLQCTRFGYGEGSPLRLHAKVDRLPLDERLKHTLPENLRKAWEKFSPSGVVSADISLTYDGRKWRPELHISTASLSVSYYRFPYRIVDAVGTVDLVDGLLKVDLETMVGGQVVLLDGEYRDPGPNFSGWTKIETKGPIPIDEKLLGALPAKQQQAIRSLSPNGSLLCTARFERRPGETTTSKKLVLDIENGGLMYSAFPYPLNRVGGRVTIDDGGWSFDRLEGYNDSAFVVARGGWASREGVLDLTLECSDVPLDDELRQALTDNARRAWLKLRPRGALDRLVVRARKAPDTGGRLSLEVTAEKRPAGQNIEGRSISIEPEFLRYRLDNVIGSARFIDGAVQLNYVRGEHGATSVELAGDCQLREQGQWSVRLTKFSVDNLVAGHDLMIALPNRLRQAISRLKIVGPLRILGDLSFAGSDHQPLSSKWNLYVDIEGGSLQGAFRADAVHGGVRFNGQYDGEHFWSRGEVSIDSAVYHDVQFTEVRGPIWMDDSQLLFGAWPKPTATRETPRSITANVFEGKLSLDGQVLSAPNSPFQIRCTLDRADLADISEELSPRGGRDVKGDVHGVLRLAGNNQGSHTWRGNGLARLRSADIYELPVMVALLNVLKLKRPERGAFESGDAEFRVVGHNVYLDRIDFKGDIVSLKGGGEFDTQRNVNLQFYTLVGEDRLQIPLIGKPVLLLIDVQGTVDEPLLTRRAFPELSERLQQLFPEAARRREARSQRMPRWRNVLPRGILR